MANITKITERTRGKIYALLVLRRNRVFKRRYSTLFTDLKQTLKPKRKRILEILKEMVKEKGKTRELLQGSFQLCSAITFRILKLTQSFIDYRRVVPRKIARDF